MNILFGLVGMILSAVVSMALSGGSAERTRWQDRHLPPEKAPEPSLPFMGSGPPRNLPRSKREYDPDEPRVRTLDEALDLADDRPAPPRLKFAAFEDDDEVETVPVPADEPAAEESASEQPVAEEPVVEEPAAVQSVAEEPVVDVFAVDEPAFPSADDERAAPPADDEPSVPSADEDPADAPSLTSASNYSVYTTISLYESGTSILDDEDDER